ncbi:GNAT family protein [Catenulispora subtropica]|uniref:GNAT family protein n=1 Tax=Catenulispora subtropica TaxID=450798 RepID=A0ABN2S7P0_9ACTN
MTYDTTESSVRLRQYTLEDCTIHEANPDAPDDRFNFFGFPVPGRLRRLVESGEVFPKPGDVHGRLAIEADGDYIGGVSWHPEHYGPIQAPAINFGITLLPKARGKGYGTEAQRLLVAYLFATTTVFRIEAATDVENIAEQRALEKAGLLREGVLRGSHYREGTYNDMVIYAITRADFEAARKAASAAKVTTGFSASR